MEDNRCDHKLTVRVSFRDCGTWKDWPKRAGMCADANVVANGFFDLKPPGRFLV